MALPQLTVAPSAAKRVRHHDCWVFKDELTSPTHSLRNGELVELADRHGAFLAYALYSAHSHIAARVVSTEQRRPWDRTLLAERLTTAIARRATLLGTNAKRLVFSEADGLSGLIVDQYADYLVVQSRTAGMETWKDAIVDLLRRLAHPKGILERSDKEFREAEGLPSLTQVLDGTVPERIRIEEDGLQFWVDPYHGQKTGFYLDQRQTRQWVRQRVRSGERVVDVCAYTGAFGIGAASRGAQVVCVEQDEGCLTLAKENAQLNQVEERMGFVAGDAFYWLKAKAESAERFDWVLLDPPSLAKSKADTLKGRQALHHLLVHALGLLAAGGTLALSVCTYHLLGLTEEILRIAAAERGVRLRILAVTMQANDHPWILQMPMTRYLMSWMAQRDG
ncbi:MAG: class I SAM-dependent rRNA methyltransferase [Candidatus Omnitrophica bacterium]|nr:class I SAM-dependent rRNA methyltransferase [Candidatus Omnitrophota bacterium]